MKAKVVWHNYVKQYGEVEFKNGKRYSFFTDGSNYKPGDAVECNPSRQVAFRGQRKVVYLKGGAK